MKIESHKGLTEHEMRVTKVTKAGPITEAVSFKSIPKGSGIVKLNQDEYLIPSSGEVKEFVHTQSRAENIKNVKQTLRQIRLLVNANVTDPKKVRWVTLTYAENMTNTEQLYQDFRVFFLRLRRWAKKNGYTKPEYISVIEPQGRGAWHIHLFLLWDTIAPYISNNEVMEKLWEHGFTKTKALNNVDNIGAYFSAYLADIPLEEAKTLSSADFALMKKNAIVLKSFEDDDKTIKEKMFIKGGRLYLYPTGMCILRHSRGIKMPTVEKMSSDAWEKKKSNEKSLLGSQTFSSYSLLYADDGSVVNAINREYYNANRKDDVKLNGKETTKDEV